MESASYFHGNAHSGIRYLIFVDGTFRLFEKGQLLLYPPGGGTVKPAKKKQGGCSLIVARLPEDIGLLQHPLLAHKWQIEREHVPSLAA